ncbi:MAG: four-carbon acid sugar kinase family protein [Verrucomicrobia bacterium]|nr:four-carbon acid sugar kinase family protein [Verrucomicrobiota bacterium]
MAFLGCIADDFTGGTDLSSNLVKRGFRTIQTLGVPCEDEKLGEVDAIVVALKSRTIPAGEATALSIEALRWLQSKGCEHFYFKFCSTFDSTPAGNIGPVVDALLDELREPFTVICPAFPDNGRTLYRGYLFVHDQLLNESGMQNHPLTPMTDPNVLRLLGCQTRSRIGLIRFDTIAQGAQAVRNRIAELRGSGVRMAVSDATSNQDLLTLGDAVSDLRLVTGGSGLALGLRVPVTDVKSASDVAVPLGQRAILAGSCSRATRGQIEHAKNFYPARQIKPIDLGQDYAGTLNSAFSWIEDQYKKGNTLLIYTSESPAEIATAQSKLGLDRSSQLVEQAFSDLARELVARGVRQLIVAGGETSGAIVNALKIRALRIGKEISPGVPWTLGLGGPYPVALALKSGNFGATNFFIEAWRVLS